MKFLTSGFLCALAFSTLQAQEQLQNESELGFANSNGNSRAEGYNFSQMNRVRKGPNYFKFNARYLSDFAGNRQPTVFFNVGARADREVSGKMTFFVGQTFEKDEFFGIRSRTMTDGGFRYFIAKSDRMQWSAEHGYRYSQEVRAPGSKYYQDHMRTQTDFQIQLDQNFSFRTWLEYLPNLFKGKDFQFNGELSLAAFFTRNFGLKSGLLLHYDHLPPAGFSRKTDSVIITALMAKF